MALIEKKLVTERETVSYKLDRTTIELVRFYSEFIGSPQEHVVNEALHFIFRKDREFNDWLKTNKSEFMTLLESSNARKGSGPSKAERSHEL